MTSAAVCGEKRSYNPPRRKRRSATDKRKENGEDDVKIKLRKGYNIVPLFLSGIL